MWAFLRLAFGALLGQKSGTRRDGPRGGPMLRVPATRVTLGGRRVRVRAFDLELLPVSNADWLRFCQETGAPHAPWMFKPGFSDPDQPVVGVTAAEARRYCRWAKRRLPTEAEWLAAIGPARYPWGDAPPNAARACFAKRAGGRALSAGTPAGTPDLVMVDGRPARPEGAGPHGHLDLVGLVLEHLERPDGRPGTIGRGGFWGSPDPHRELRVELALNERSTGLGFRCAR